jgi:thioredoxin-related protein
MRPIVDRLEAEFGASVDFERHEWRKKSVAKLVDLYGVSETPTLVILDGAGKIVLNQGGIDSYSRLKTLLIKAGVKKA